MAALGLNFFNCEMGQQCLGQVVSEKHECFEIRHTRFKYWLPGALGPEGISASSFIEGGY